MIARELWRILRALPSEATAIAARAVQCSEMNTRR